MPMAFLELGRMLASAPFQGFIRGMPVRMDKQDRRLYEAVAVARVIEGRGWLKWPVFVVCLVLFGYGQFSTAFGGASRYAAVQKAEWDATNVWLESTECARSTGAWLAICDGNRLIPIS